MYFYNLWITLKLLNITGIGTSRVVKFWMIFLTYHSVGHEPADIQVQNIAHLLLYPSSVTIIFSIYVANVTSSLDKAHIYLSKMICLSRDNPNVMKKMFRLLEEEAIAQNNPRIIDATWTRYDYIP